MVFKGLIMLSPEQNRVFFLAGKEDPQGQPTLRNLVFSTLQVCLSRVHAPCMTIIL